MSKIYVIGYSIECPEYNTGTTIVSSREYGLYMNYKLNDEYFIRKMKLFTLPNDDYKWIDKLVKKYNLPNTNKEHEVKTDLTPEPYLGTKYTQRVSGNYKDVSGYRVMPRQLNELRKELIDSKRPIKIEGE